MTGPLYRLGGFCTRHALGVFIAWIVFAIGISVGATGAGRPTSDDTTIPGSDSTAATDLLEQKLPSQANGSVPIVVQANSGKLTEGANKTAVEKTVDALKANQYVRSVVSPLSNEGSTSLAEHDTLGIISTNLTLGSGDLDDEAAESVFDETAPASDAGLEVSAGGYLGSQLSSPSTRLSEIVGIVAAMIVLVFVLGTVLSMVMPIATALVGVFSGLGVDRRARGRDRRPLDRADAGDHARPRGRRRLLAVHRQPLPAPCSTAAWSHKEAVARAVATSGGAVLFAGTTVVISLLCLYFGGIPQVQQLGYSAAIAVAVVIVASLTMLPAGLSLLGERINSLRVRNVPEEGEIDPENPNGWARWAQGIGRHPLIAAIAGIIVLVVLAIPVLQIELGAQDNGQMPESTTIRQAYDALERGLRRRLQRAAAGRRRRQAAGPERPEVAEPARIAGAAATAAGAAGDRADDGAARGGGRAARPGAAGGDPAGRGPGAEPVTAAADPAAEGVPRVAGLRPAPGQAADEDPEGRRRRRRSHSRP